LRFALFNDISLTYQKKKPMHVIFCSPYELNDLKPIPWFEK
jgi:hypothetical protein